MKISYEQERRLTKALFKACGMSDEHADIAGDGITHSDFTGVYSHGVSRFTGYLNRFMSGAYNPTPDIKVLKDEGAIVGLDCDKALGIISVEVAYDMVLPKAREYGIAICTGRESSNIGCGSYYGWKAAKDDMILLLCCNTYLAMAPFGGADKLIGTNPIVAAVPTSGNPIVMDISTSGVAMGKIQAYAREGKELPVGWANDIDGNPTTDPKAAYTVLPIAAHKGYGLAVIVDLIGAALGGACFGSEIGSPKKLEAEHTGFCLILIDPSKFMPIDAFKARTDAYIHMMKNSRPAKRVKEIFMPGELEFIKFEESKAYGVEVSEALASEIVGIAAKLGVVKEGTSFEELLAAV